MHVIADSEGVVIGQSPLVRILNLLDIAPHVVEPPGINFTERF